MKCSRCEHENPSGMRFCGQCSAPLAVVCPACGAANPPENRFCGHCAAALGPSVSAPKGAGPEGYTPRHLADKILALRSSLEGERKQVTVLFCDIANSTPLAEHLGAEAMHALLDRFFTLSLAEVHRYEGTVNQFLGDGFMALFGAPVAHEDHAQRAVLAAAAVRRAVSGREGALSLRMGLNTGDVVVGSIGDNLRMDYTAIGDTTNLAARLQQAGAPGSILLGEATWRLVRDLVRVEDLGPVEVKGKAARVRAYRLVAVGPTRAPIAARVERPLSHFVGRERELATLRDLLIQAEQGHGQLVGLVGEPGVGKSRLLYEFRQGLAGRSVTYLEGRCLSWGRTIPYLPILEIVRANCGVADADAPEAVAAKVRVALHELGMDFAEAGPYVLHLLGLKEGTERLEVLSAHALKERTFDTLRQMAVRGSGIRPLILGVEDLHWIDATSEEYLGALAEGLAGLPVLLVATYRPGYRVAWIDKSYATQIALRPLSPEDGLAVVRSVLGEAPAVEPVARAILDKAEGNPFFIEELSRALLDHPELGHVRAVPATIQDVLMARIDRLPEDAKRLLQTAAVLGREVPARLLAAVWGDALALEPALSELRRLEFLYELSGPAEAAHVFKHALTQEVAYESLLASRRQALHASVGRALETMYAERLEDAYDRLAYHYGRAGDPEKAVLYLSLVATRAARNYAHAESASAFRQAREHAEHLPESERERRVFDMLLGEWKALFYLGRRREAVELVLEFEDRVNRLADPLQVARLYWTLGVNWGFLGDRERTQASLMRAVTAAREAGDDQSLGGCIMMAAAERLFAGRARECVELARQAAAHLMLGEVGPAREALGRLRSIGETTGDPRIRCNAAGRLGFLEALVGDLGTAITWCRQAVELAPEPYERAQAIGWLGYAYLERGDGPQAVAMLEEADRAAAYFSRHMQVLFKAYLADAYHAISRFDAAEALTRQVQEIARDEGYPLVTATALRTAGRIALARGATAEARARLEEALRAFTEIEWRLEIARTHLDLAAAAHAGADPVACASSLREAHTLFASLGVAREVARTAERAQALGVTLPPPPGYP